MLNLIHETKLKKAAQTTLESNLKTLLTRQGVRNIGFPGGNVNQTLYSLGGGNLWGAFGKPSADSAVPRFWNAFGIYEPNRPAQMISVEINIAVESNSAQVAGFFAEDSDTGDIFLMHSGKIGGGRTGVGKSAFLVWSKAKLVDVFAVDGDIRSGIAVGKLNDPDLAGRIQKFVRIVQGFKAEAEIGGLATPNFKRRLEEFDKYRKEFSGSKRGVHRGAFEYVTYHGDIVQKLYDERTARLVAGEKVFNSTLVDLFVKKNGVLSEVYEVKTGVDRQMLYTAIGQMLTHATTKHAKVAMFIVIPAKEVIPPDFVQAFAILGIQVLRFRLGGTSHNRVVEFD